MTITEKWKAEGEAKGKIEGKMETAKAMLDKGLDISLIVEITKLPIEEIQKLKESS